MHTLYITFNINNKVYMQLYTYVYGHMDKYYL